MMPACGVVSDEQVISRPAQAAPYGRGHGLAVCDGAVACGQRHDDLTAALAAPAADAAI